MCTNIKIVANTDKMTIFVMHQMFGKQKMSNEAE